MPKSKILLQLDTDPQVSAFDSIVAIDSDVDQLLRFANVDSDSLEALVHGAMFTRGESHLAYTAIFFGGSDIAKAEALVARTRKCFFGDFRVSLMSDPNGSNTTAAAAVLCAERHLDLKGALVTVLAGTGPVGIRIAHLAGLCGARLRICSRSLERATEACEFLRLKFESAESSGESPVGIEPFATPDATSAVPAIDGADVVFAAGASGVELLAADWRDSSTTPSVAIDVNAVAPAGIAGIEPFDKAKELGQTICYGAVGVGGLKMKIHKHCLHRLFESNDQVLDTTEIYELGKTV